MDFDLDLENKIIIFKINYIKVRYLEEQEFIKNNYIGLPMEINSIIAKDNSFNEHYHRYFGVSKRFYNPLEIIIRFFRGVFVQRDAFHLNISMKNYQKLN